MNATDFESLVGLPAAKRALNALFRGESPMHAVLFFGEEGSGKSVMAEALAAYWLCQEPTTTGACGRCRACESGMRGKAVDRLDIMPRGLSNWIHVAGIQRVDNPPPEYEELIPLLEFLRTPPLRSPRKVVVMSQADRMNAEASNSLLKVLEEPPEFARLVLTTSEMGRLRPTIRSRCLAVPCELPNEAEWDEANPHLEIWERVLAGRSSGRLRRIRRSPEIFRGLFDLADLCRRSGPGSSLALAERFKKLSDGLAKAEESNARHAGGSALSALAAAMSHFRASEHTVRRIALAHRRIAGNVGAGLEYDALFASITGEPGVPA